MKKIIPLILTVSALLFACEKQDPENELKKIIDHEYADLSGISDEQVEKATQSLHIAYGHTSHGSQLTSGMTGLVQFGGEKYAWNNGGTNGALDLHDYAMTGDLGNPDFTEWEVKTRSYLAEHPGVNVIIWSWCGQVSGATEANIDTYLGLMSGLEADFPAVVFVYMTGHLDGSGLSGNLHLRNEQIRDYCLNNNSFLYDFADIESYDPDGSYYLDKNANDGCWYDSDGNGSLDANWALRWQDTHTEGVDWYTCSAAHSEPLNANMKAYAAWRLWTEIAAYLETR